MNIAFWVAAAAKGADFAAHRDGFAVARAEAVRRPEWTET